MSKKFTPQASPSDSPQTFSVHPAPVSESVIFQIQWPELKSREYTVSEREKRDELEKRLLQEAEQKAGLVEKAAYEKGFGRGERDGREAGRQRVEATRQELQSLLTALQGQKEETYEKLERELVALAFTLFRKILGQENPFPETVIRETLRSAFQEVRDQKEVCIRLNPKDCDPFRPGAVNPSGLPDEETPGGARIVADPSITRGGCILETSFGAVDATVETRFDILAALFWEKVKNSGFPANPHE